MVGNRAPGKGQAAGNGTGSGLGEVLFEFQRVGSYLKVMAIDPVTATEVSVVGPATGSLELLKRTAISKLQFVMKRDAAKR
ncbi:DUF6898 family protein [Azospirillum aestuarii]|uniref:DUF6898 family protein n=1 Tax=Azospirillum aestuarii TaxID=2802052 RepID=UPI00119B27FF|nr:hypothetical protein [Azospirillum brasilense]TWA89190.1 hypothetical protein FBY14_10667 [Azospirillum brasilense]